MNYVKIGQRVRKYRKAKGLSQEALAEIVGISVTHMSHVETGNTKLSLQVLVDVAKALDVGCDNLLFDGPSDRNRAEAEILELLAACTSEQLPVLLDLLKATKNSLDKHMSDN